MSSRYVLPEDLSEVAEVADAARREALGRAMSASVPRRPNPARPFWQDALLTVALALPAGALIGALVAYLTR